MSAKRWKGIIDGFLQSDELNNPNSLGACMIHSGPIDSILWDAVCLSPFSFIRF